MSQIALFSLYYKQRHSNTLPSLIHLSKELYLTQVCLFGYVLLLLLQRNDQRS